MARLEPDDNPLFITNGTDATHMLNVSSSGKVDVNWDDCPITEDSIRSIASEESKKILELKTQQLKEELDNESPIRIMRRKVQSWLKD